MIWIVILGFLSLTFCTLVLLNRGYKLDLSKIWKVFSYILMVIFFVWFLLAGGNSLSNVFNLTIDSPFNNANIHTVFSPKVTTFFALIAVWSLIILHSITVLIPFFKQFKVAKLIERYITPILLVIVILNIKSLIYTYTKTTEYRLAGIILCTEIGLILGKMVYIYAFDDSLFTRIGHEILNANEQCSKSYNSSKDKKIVYAFIGIGNWFKSIFRSYVSHLKSLINKIKSTDKKTIIEFIVAIFILYFFSQPEYVPHALFGKIQTVNKGVLDFAVFHRMYIYIMFVYMIGLAILVRGKEYEYKRMFFLYICFVSMINYSSGYTFKSFTTPWNWPLHICNTAMYILPIAIATKSEKVFYFTFFINVLGAFLAAFMPNYDANIYFLSNRAVGFWQNHIEAACMPMTLVLAKVFKRPTKKQFFYSMVGFCIYFVFVLVINTYLTGYREIYAQSHNGYMYDIPDFFYINSDFVGKKLHLESLFNNFIVNFKFLNVDCRIYPVYQISYFGTFIGLSIGMWFVYTWAFKAQDALETVNDKYKKVRMDEIALCVKNNVKEVSMCMSELSKNKLVISHFSKKYGEKAPFAVQDINFEAQGGEIVGFLGPNGAGKSTTIKAIVGIHLPSEGTIEINGYDIVSQPVQAKAQLGFVPDHYALYENLTGREYLNYIADLYNVSQKDRTAFLDEFLETLQMKKAIDNKMQTYSHGMKQKIAIMASIIHNPKLWILDEPLTGLDPVSIYQVKQCLLKHAQKGNIVFFSSHLIDIVEKLCDRIVIISDHKVQDIANVHELLSKNINLEQYYMEKTGLVTGDK